MKMKDNMKQYKLFVQNAKPTNIFKDIQSPYSSEFIAKVEQADAGALEQSLKNANYSFHAVMKKMPAYRRAEILYAVSQMIKENHEALALAIVQEGGKPLKDARIEVTRAINTVKMCGDTALELNGDQITMDRASGTEYHIAFTLREPIGPVLAISAFNHPVNLVCHQIASAVAAGNSVIIKPSSQTPISCLKIAEFFYSAGLDPSALSVVTVSGKDIDLIIGDERITFVNFIGGEDVGWELKQKIAPGTKLALEHGGTGTAIIHETADLKTAIPSIIRAGFYHAGQVCVSTQIVYIHESMYEKAVSLLAEAAKKLITGDPARVDTDVGPLIHQKEVARIDLLVKGALHEGARLLCGGTVLPNNCYAPTILAETRKTMKVIACEIFGPVVCVQKYSEMSEVIKEMNESPYSFQSAIYSQDIDAALTAAREIQCRAFMINESTAFRVDWMPFGGSKRSGLGLSGTRDAVFDMTEQKLIVIKHKPRG